MQDDRMSAEKDVKSLHAKTGEKEPQNAGEKESDLHEPASDQLAPFSLQDVLHVTVLPPKQYWQTLTHWPSCFRS